MSFQRFVNIPLAACVFLLAFAPVLAQDTVNAPSEASPAIQSESKAETVDIVPSNAKTAEKYQIDTDSPTHPPINLSPDKSEIIHLNQKAATIISGNPNHLSIIPSNSKEIVLVGRAPGATYFTALDRNGEIIMQRHVIVAGPKEKYVRIRKTCAGQDKCQSTQVYYCPDTCHEIMLNVQESGSSSAAAIPAEQAVQPQAAANNQDGLTQ